MALNQPQEVGGGRTARERPPLPASFVPPPNDDDGTSDVVFAADMASLHALSLAARRNAYQSSLPAAATDGTPTRAALQIGYALLAYATFLATTWSRVLIVLPNIIFEPLTFVSVLLFSVAASLFLFGVLLASTFSLLPYVRTWVQRAIDYVMLGPYQKWDVETALYYTRFPQEIKDSALRALSSPVQTDFEDQDGSELPRTIDLDVARYLMSLCALVYLRDSNTYTEELRKPSTTSASVENRLRNSVDKSNARSSLSENRSQSSGEVPSFDSVISHIAQNSLQLQYKPLCELASRHASPQRPSTPFVGLFYSPDNPTFIILSFKGTTPNSFPDWLVDFTFPYLPANAELDAYGSVHEGFYRAIFPRDARPYTDAAASLPWNLIRMEIMLMVKQLDARQPNESKQNINVWITGHSLGAALAQMFFAKALQSEDQWKVKVEEGDDVEEEKSGDDGEERVAKRSDPGKKKKTRHSKAILRDCYTFGTPIFGDVFSRGSFNNCLFSPEKRRRHEVWRFVNHDDIVATGLPGFGDMSYSQGWLPAAISSTSDTGGLGGLNQFSFTHVGQEVTLKDGDKSYVGPGTLWPWGTKVILREAATPLDANGVRPYLSSLSWLMVWLQRIPFLGRVMAHAPILYAYQLEKCIGASGEGLAMAWAVQPGRPEYAQQITSRSS